jgi:hypothetical protein
MSYSAYYKRVNRYGNNLQERVQGKKEHDFLTFMSKSPNLVRARNGEDENYYEAVLQTKEYDQDEVTSYLLVPLDEKIPMGTVIYTKDTRHASVLYEDKIYEERRWINYSIDPYTSTGYNRYTVVELESELSWVLDGIRYSSYAHATGGGSGARDKNINLKFNVQFSEAGVYLPNKRYSIIMPTHPKLKKNMKITLGEETWRVTGFDNVSVKGVSYVTLEETLTDEKEDIPVANAGQLKNWTVTTNRGDNFIVMRDSVNELELFFFYDNEPREISYRILEDKLFSIKYENGRTLLKTTHSQGETSLKIILEGWDEQNYLEIPFSIKDYTTSPLKMVGPTSVYMGEKAVYVIKNADLVGYDTVKLDNATATMVSKSLDEETGDLTIIILGKSIGKNKVIINDYSFDFEVRSLWLGGED